MSKLVVEVCKIEEIKEIEGADRLEIAILKGWQTVVPKGEFKPGDKAVFIPYDTCISAEIADKLGVKKYLRGKNNDIVGRTNLRGVPSFGIVTKPFDIHWPIGKDVSKEYGATKYEPPIKRVSRFGGNYTDKAKQNQLFTKYTDIENLRHYNNVLQNGEVVYITEKLDGSSSRVGVIDGQIICASRNWQLYPPGFKAFNKKPNFIQKFIRYVQSFFPKKIDLEEAKKNWYWYSYSLESVRNFLEDYSKKHKQVIIFGETFGPVQVLNYGLKELSWRAYDIMIDAKWLDYDQFLEICTKYNIPHVPVLYKGPYSIDIVRNISKGNTTLNNGPHIREGVVVRPEKERIVPRFGRAILKYINDDYLMDKKLEEADTTDN
jgi:RNA ligase (TIGR02306 family)